MSKVKLILIIISFGCQLFYSQSKIFDKNDIDSILKIEYTYLNNHSKFDDAKVLLKKALNESKKISYSTGVLESTIKLANIECTLKNFDKSLQLLDTIESELLVSNDFYLKVLFHIEYGRNLSESRVDQNEAIQNFNKALGIVNNIKDLKEKISLEAYLLQNLYISHWRANEKRKGVDFLIKSEKIQSDLYNLSCLTYYHIHETKNLDSIKLYLTKSSNYIKDRNGYEFELTMLNNQWGRYYQDIANYKKAIIYYKNADSLARKINLTNERIYALKRLHECYKSIGEFETSLNYLDQYTKLYDSLTDVRRKTYDLTVKQIAKNEINESEYKFKKLILVLAIILTLLSFTIYYLTKQKKVTQNIIENQERVISEIEEDKLVLEKKNNISFDE